jgi:hypothetical protein
MSQIENYKEEYLRQTRVLLSDDPKELQIFEELWAAGKLREAYTFVMDTANRLNLKRSDENRKADENFFGHTCTNNEPKTVAEAGMHDGEALAGTASIPM